MAVALEQFVQQLEDSGILAAETLREFLPPNAAPQNAEELARELVRQRKLTKFQATQLWQGKGKSLVLGNYVLLDKIGQGGMGAVFKAEHRRIGGAVLGVMILLAGASFIFKTTNDTSVAPVSEPDTEAQKFKPLEKSAEAEAVIAGKPWESPAFRRWMKDVAAMPAEKQVEAVSKTLMELNPGFDGKLSNPNIGQESSPPLVQNGDVVELEIITDKVADLSPIRALSELRRLHCTFTQATAQRLDLSPLHGMRIRMLKTVHGTVDLSEVKGLPLSELACFGSGVTNLTPISGMPLHTLWLTGNWELTNLAPLKGMPLTVFTCDNTQIADLSPLSGMPLTVLICHVTKVAVSQQRILETI